MKRYTIIVSEEAIEDIEDYYFHILYVYKQPLTAIRNRAGLYESIKRLAVSAGSIAFSQYDFIQRNYGPNARHIIYKKMAIIYTVFDDIAYIKRIIAGSLIH
jgi:hypothetical protein